MKAVLLPMLQRGEKSGVSCFLLPVTSCQPTQGVRSQFALLGSKRLTKPKRATDTTPLFSPLNMVGMVDGTLCRSCWLSAAAVVA